MCTEKITFEKLPEAVGFLIHEVNQIKKLIEENQHPEPTRRPIEINEACKIIMKAKSTVYALVRKGILPCYKNGKKLYFYEDELLEWINRGKKPGIANIQAEIHSSMEPDGVTHNYSIPFSKNL